MSNCNSTTWVGLSSRCGWTLALIFIVGPSCAWRISSISGSFSLVGSSNLLLGCTRFHILIVSSSTSTRSLRLIGCWTLPIIVSSGAHSSTISSFVSTTYWQWVMTCMTIRHGIWWIIWISTIFLFSIHYYGIMGIIMEVGFCTFLSLIMNIILYRNINFYSKLCSI